VQALENITEVLRNVVPPIPPYELPERVNALRRSFGPGSIPDRGSGRGADARRSAMTRWSSARRSAVDARSDPMAPSVRQLGEKLYGDNHKRQEATHE